MAENKRIISWNVNGIRASVKKGFLDKVKELKPDIICLQETKADEKIVSEIAAGLQEYNFYINSAMKKGYSGTVVFSIEEPIGFTYDLGVEEHDQEGRLITLEYNDFYLVNVYVPNSGNGLKRLPYRETWDNALLNHIKNLKTKKPVIFTGDLNVAHEPIDLANPKSNYNKSAGYTQKEIDGFKQYLDAGFTDTFRHFYPDKVQYSYWSQRMGARERNVGWRLDYFLVSRGFMPHVKDSLILDQVMGSDHCPVRLDVEL